MIKESFSFDDVIDSLKEKAGEIKSNAIVDASHAIARPAAKPDGEIKDITFKDRMMHSALNGIAALAVTGAFSKIFKRKTSLPLYLANAAAGAATGYFTPDVANIFNAEARGDIDKQEAKRLLRTLDKSSIKAFDETKEVAELYGGINKKAAFVKSVKNIAVKGAKGTGGLLWKGMFPRYKILEGAKTPFRRKVLSFGVRGGALAGAGYGAFKGVQQINAPRSGQNYTTFLRNQMLAGNVQPEELSQRDLISVRKLGMR